jgi:hypothetical protein
LKTKFDAHPFANNQMADLENEATQYEFPNEGRGNVGGLDLYESPSPFILRAVKDNEHQAPKTQMMFHDNRYTIIGN